MLGRKGRDAAMSVRSTNSRWDILVILQLFLGIGGIAGGAMLVIDPSGGMMGMDISILKNWPLSDFLIPGLILLIVLGILPVVIGWALLKRWSWPLAERLNLFPDLHWSWAFSLYIAFALIIWISVEMYIMAGVGVVHLFYIALGLAIQAASVLPGVQKNYRV